MVGIICAMEVEIENLRKVIKNAETSFIGSVEFIKGSLHEKDVVVAKCGAGKVNAAVCTQTMILTYRPDVIINTGVAGSLSPDLSIGNIVIATSTVQHDMDTTGCGDPIGYVSGIGRVFFDCDKETITKLSAASEVLENVKTDFGIVATGDSFVTDPERKRFITDTFYAVACEMEGCSVGQVCIMNDVPFGIVRAISDNADADSEMDYPAFVKIAADISAKLVTEFVKIS